MRGFLYLADSIHDHPEIDKTDVLTGYAMIWPKQFDITRSRGLSCYKDGISLYWLRVLCAAVLEVFMAESVSNSNGNGTVFHTHRLSNGLQIVAQPMPDFESVALSYYVRTGSRDELNPDLYGVSHFLEHMVFKGTQTLDWQQITLEFNKIGAELNAYTSH